MYAADRCQTVLSDHLLDRSSTLNTNVICAAQASCSRCLANWWSSVPQAAMFAPGIRLNNRAHRCVLTEIHFAM